MGMVMAASVKEIVPLAACIVMLATLFVVYERIPVVHLGENPYVACINDAASSPELTKTGIPISAACPGF